MGTYWILRTIFSLVIPPEQYSRLELEPLGSILEIFEGVFGYHSN
jgi:hypothetical protein